MSKIPIFPNLSAILASLLGGQLLFKDHLASTAEGWKSDLLSWYQAHAGGLFSLTISAGWEGCIFGNKYNNNYGCMILLSYSNSFIIKVNAGNFEYADAFYNAPT